MKSGLQRKCSSKIKPKLQARVSEEFCYFVHLASCFSDYV